MANAKTKAIVPSVKTDEHKKEIVVGNCVRVTIHVRTKCRDASGKPSVRMAQMKSADSQSSPPPMQTMSNPTGSSGGGTEPMVNVDITIEVNN